MSDTPRTDEAAVSREFIAREMDHYAHKFVLADFARQLERELAEARRERDEAQFRAQNRAIVLSEVTRERNEARAECERLTKDRDEWAAKWRETRKQLAELKFPGMTGVVKANDAARKEGT